MTIWKISEIISRKWNTVEREGNRMEVGDLVKVRIGPEGQEVIGRTVEIIEELNHVNVELTINDTPEIRGFDIEEVQLVEED
jgi:hypothetical protein